MHSDEWNELVDCRDCGATVDPTDRGFAIDDEEVLCFACAVRRGGIFDEERDEWVVLPSLGDAEGGALSQR